MLDRSTAEQSDYYVFVNRAAFWVRQNFERTGAFVSGGFAAAAPEALPAGILMAWAGGPAAPQGDAARQAYVDGTLDFLQFVPNPRFFGIMTPFATNVINNYRVEYDAEMARRSYNRLLPSRLSAVYAFTDIESCELAASRWEWPLDQVRRFRLVPHALNRVTRVNMEIVSLARSAYPRGTWSGEDIGQIWRSYWAGSGNIDLDIPTGDGPPERRSSGVMWEHLIDCVMRPIRE
jgi:hypothetical protein